MYNLIHSNYYYLSYPLKNILDFAKATDADDGSNALIKYSMSVSIEEIKSYEETLQLGELPPFSIGSHNGSISVASPINRLNGHILPHQIIATDRNGSGLSTSLDLIVITKYSPYYILVKIH